MHSEFGFIEAVNNSKRDVFVQLPLSRLWSDDDTINKMLVAIRIEKAHPRTELEGNAE